MLKSDFITKQAAGVVLAMTATTSVDGSRLIRRKPARKGITKPNQLCQVIKDVAVSLS